MVIFHFLVLITGIGLSYSQELQLESWMDDKFGAPIKANASDCYATVYEYNELVHMNGWDCSADSSGLKWIEVARPERVNRELLVKFRKDIIIPGRKKSKPVETYQVGDPKKARFAVIFIHGANGDKRLGSRDTNMGGNFNRLMNLVVRNGGVYYSPTTDFKDNGEGVQTIIDQLQSDRPGIKVVIACGSAGALTCDAVSNRSDAVKHLAGLIVLAAAGGLNKISKSKAYKNNIPIIIAHGSRDGVSYALENFKKMRVLSSGKNYPVWMQVFDDGGHGTPFRMIDWRASLNWIFEQQGKKITADCPTPSANIGTPGLLSTVSTVIEGRKKIETFNCDQFFKFPFIEFRPLDANYTATKKSSCFAPKLEETPGEDLHIVPIK